MSLINTRKERNGQNYINSWMNLATYLAGRCPSSVLKNSILNDVIGN